MLSLSLMAVYGDVVPQVQVHSIQQQSAYSVIKDADGKVIENKQEKNQEWHQRDDEVRAKESEVKKQSRRDSAGESVRGWFEQKAAAGHRQWDKIIGKTHKKAVDLWKETEPGQNPKSVLKSSDKHNIPLTFEGPSGPEIFVPETGVKPARQDFKTLCDDVHCVEESVLTGEKDSTLATIPGEEP